MYIYVKYRYTYTHTSGHKYVSSYIHQHHTHTCGSYTGISTHIQYTYTHKHTSTSIMLLCSQEKTLKSPGLRTRNCIFHSELTQTWPHPVRSSNLFFVSILILQQKGKEITRVDSFRFKTLLLQIYDARRFSFRFTMI